MTTSTGPRALLVRSGARTCAVAVEHVVETLRPLPIEPLAGAPEAVLGAAIVRGQPVPVVDLATLLSGEPSGRVARWVILRIGERRAALAVDAVIGVGAAAGDRLPPLLEGACGAAVEALGAADRDLLVVLAASRVVPDSAWDAIGREGLEP